MSFGAMTERARKTAGERRMGKKASNKDGRMTKEETSLKFRHLCSRSECLERTATLFTWIYPPAGAAHPNPWSTWLIKRPRVTEYCYTVQEQRHNVPKRRIKEGN
jgi:hypothetical protein